MTTTPIRYALISVSDKTGIVDFARHLSEMNITLLSTGGTARMLREQNIDVVDVAHFTDSPEIMNGRVKTLHPKIHGGLLARRGVDDEVMAEQAFQFIDLVVVNLYPFERTVSDPKHTLPDAIENIDIGGPTMVRAAAKNYDRVAIVVDHNDYNHIVEEIRNNNGTTTQATRFALMKKAFTHTAHYDTAISHYLTHLNKKPSSSPAPESLENEQHHSTFPNTLAIELKKQDDLRYGENPHQNAAFYVENNAQSGTISSAEQHQGKPLSFNNIADTDAALECVKSFSGKPACVIVKHANPCGVAFRDAQLDAYERAFATDSTSSFGGIIAFNTTLEKKTAQAIIEKQFVEVIIAPNMEDGVGDIVAAKKNVRLLTTGAFQSRKTDKTKRWDYKRVNGGLLVQDADDHMIAQNALKTVSKRAPTEKEMQDLLFAWKVVKFVKSNAIVYCKDDATIGIGAGQMSRVISAKIAGLKAEEEGLDVPGSVMASDAFFPFRDGIDAAAKAGITAIIQPGGSIRDDEIIQAADEANIAMVFTGVRHFRH